MTEIIHDVSPPDFRVITERERHLMQHVHMLNHLIEEQQKNIERLRSQLLDPTSYATSIRERDGEIERLRRRLYEVDAQLTAEDRIHAKECMALRAEKDAEIERLRAENLDLRTVINKGGIWEAEIAQVRADYERLYQQLEQCILNGTIKIPHDTEFMRVFAEKERLRFENANYRDVINDLLAQRALEPKP